MKKVNLFVVGAMRAGTTSFVQLLASHPSIYVPPIKESHYFSEPLPKAFLERSPFFSIAAYFKKTFPKPLHSAQIVNSDQYEQLYSLATHQKYLVDASTSYLHEPSAAEKIKEYNPLAKVIIITRNPLERTYSHYKMDVGLGRISKTFEEIMKEEVQLYQQEKLHWYSHLAMSFYNKSINRYQELFEKVLVLNLEALINDTPTEMKKVSTFLEIEPFPEINFDHKNAALRLKNPKSIYLLKKAGIVELISMLLNKNAKNKLLKRASKNKQTAIPISDQLQKKLEEIFRKENV